MSEEVQASRPVGPVHRAFGLLQLVVAADEPVGVRDLARRSGLSRSTTGRMLGILTELGMVERTAVGAVAPGAGLAGLTASASRSGAVTRARLRPLTVDLRVEFGENAALGVDDGSAFRYIDSARLDSAVQVPDPAGERFDFHLVAPGLVAMADWPADRLRSYLVSPLVAATERSVTEPGRIRARLRRIREDGFAWTDQELDLDVNGVATPIRSRTGELVAVATLYGPAYRLSAEQSPGLGAALATFVSARGSVLLGS